MNVISRYFSQFSTYAVRNFFIRYFEIRYFHP